MGNLYVLQVLLELRSNYSFPVRVHNFAFEKIEPPVVAQTQIVRVSDKTRVPLKERIYSSDYLGSYGFQSCKSVWPGSSRSSGISRLESTPRRSGNTKKYRCSAWSLIMSPSYANRRSAPVCSVTAISCALSIAIREAKRWATEHVPQIRDRKDGTATIRLPLTAIVKNRR